MAGRAAAQLGPAPNAPAGAPHAAGAGAGPAGAAGAAPTAEAAALEEQVKQLREQNVRVYMCMCVCVYIYTYFCKLVTSAYIHSSNTHAYSVYLHVACLLVCNESYF